MHTQTLQSKIDQLSAAGGGTLTLPAGEHLCGTLFLKSGVDLNLDEGCILRASPQESDYPVLGTTVNETGVMRAMIFAENANDISISGQGLIEGLGDHSLSWDQSESVSFRPETILLRDCHNVQLSDFTIRNSSFWTVHLLRCEDVEISGLTLRNRRDRINTDGIDPDGCKRVVIRDCDIDVGDDGIVLKSTEGDDCEDITIENCRIRTSCAGLKLGTETLGDIRNVTIRNCQLRDCEMGFGIFLKDGGTIENIQVEGLDLEGPGEFFLFIDHTPRYFDTSAEGTLRNIQIQNLSLNSPGRIFVKGGEQTLLDGLTLKNLEWTLPCLIPLGKNGKPMGSVRSRPNPQRAYPERDNSQITLRNVGNLHLTDITFHSESETSNTNEPRDLITTNSVSGTIQKIQSATSWIRAEKAYAVKS